MTKKFIFRTAILLLSCYSFSQSLEKEVQPPDIAGKLFHNPPKGNRKIQGSPYSNSMFSAAKVEKAAVQAYMRYNIVNDEFEFITPKNDTLILDKIEDFADITFTGTNKKYKLVPYTNNKNQLAYGYLINIYQKGYYTLFKKENIHFNEEKIAKTTLEMNMPAKYVKSDDTFYLKYKDQSANPFPNNKKGLVKLFPERKDTIEKFLKENKISIDEPSDMIKILDFLATL